MPTLFFLLAVAFQLMHTSAAEPIPAQAANRVCYISNAGFFIDTPDGDILIDGILSSNDEIANAEGGFSDVRLIFVGHVHGDHFNAEGIVRHMQANPATHLIVTPQSFQALQRAGWDKSWDERTIVSLPDWDELEPFTAGAIRGAPPAFCPFRRGEHRPRI